MYAFDGKEIWNFWKRALGEMKRGVCDPIVVFSAPDGLEISRVLVSFRYSPIASWLWICAMWISRLQWWWEWKSEMELRL
jgi:hypothetical protein